jgi:hypothetical protein
VADVVVEEEVAVEVVVDLLVIDHDLHSPVVGREIIEVEVVVVMAVR